MKGSSRLAFTVWSWSSLLLVAGHAADFTALGTFASPNRLSEAAAVSADGQTVVGRSMTENGFSAFRWTSSEGIQPLGSLMENGASEANSVSADGSLIVGQSDSSISGGIEAFQWSQGTGLSGLGALPDGQVELSRAFGVSGDGGTIVGGSNTSAFRWTEAEGLVDLGDVPGGGTGTTATAVSFDGGAIVGFGRSAESGLFNEAFHWTTEGGFTLLGFLDSEGDTKDSAALAANRDGSVVVGRSSLFEGFSLVSSEAFRWTEAQGMQGLGHLSEAQSISTAQAVSGNGERIVGESQTAEGRQAFLWTEEAGMRSLSDALRDEFGLADGTLEGWTLESATGISDDGFTVVGFGRNPQGHREAFLALLTPHPGDADADGDVDLADFNLLKANFGSSQPRFTQGEVTGDGQVDLNDFGLLKNNFGFSSEAVAVPEPASLALAVCGLFLLALRARTRRLS